MGHVAPAPSFIKINENIWKPLTSTGLKILQDSKRRLIKKKRIRKGKILFHQLSPLVH